MNTTASKALFEVQTDQIAGRLLEARHWRVFTIKCPVVDIGFEIDGRTGLRLWLNFDDWNDQPPSILLLSMVGEPLATVPRDPGGVFNSSAHPATRRPFICMAGSREYHTHPSHVNDSWDNYKSRGGYDIGGILTQLWYAWQKAHP